MYQRKGGKKGLAQQINVSIKVLLTGLTLSSKPGKKVAPKCDDHTSADRRPVAAVYPPDSPHNFIIIV